MKRVSQVMGIDEQELVQRAMRFYLASMQQEIALEKELQAWEWVSDEALLNMERGFFRL